MKEFLAVMFQWLPVEKILALIEQIRINRLKNSFQYIGKNVVLSSGLYVECPNYLHVGDNVSIAREVSLMGAGGIKIGEKTMISTRVSILTTTHDANSKEMWNSGIHRSVVIGCGVWIGACALILPGVTISNDAVIGAGAVVTHDILPHEVVGGVPARVLWERRVAEVK